MGGRRGGDDLWAVQEGREGRRGARVGGREGGEVWWVEDKMRRLREGVAKHPA
jgi:hypothetical protein